MKRKTANTVIYYFNVLDAGVIVIPLGNFIDSFKVFSRREYDNVSDPNEGYQQWTKNDH